MGRRWLQVTALSMVCVLIAGCASAGVRATRSDEHAAVTVADTTVANTSTPNTGTSVPGRSSADLPDIGPVAWHACTDYPGPWQCGEIQVPLDYTDPAGTQMTIAMIRLRARDSGHRIGSLVLNPGGPGGSGIQLAYGEGETFPGAVLDRFDIVGFDPRGVGLSSPVTCPVGFDPSSNSYDDCLPANLAVLPYLGTRNVARDLEMIRKAVRDDRLTYLGYSYGTALGAVYADMFGDRVRAMVLDGAVDPDAGLSNSSSGGSDFYADQDFDTTTAMFEELCDATVLCAAGPHSRELLQRVEDNVAGLPTAKFPSGERLRRSDVADIVVNSMYSTFDWPMLAIALEDADNGDASTLAAFSSWLLYGYPADETTTDDSGFANIAIRCADFSNRSVGSFECQNFPATRESLPVITPVATATPILVVGTKGDPATPARYAPAMARALGSAVAIEWEGAGHTATLSSRCITDIVADYLVNLTAPADGTMCPFVVGTTTLAERADSVFATSDPTLAAAALATVLVAEGDPAKVASCVAGQIVRRGNERLIVHQLIGVASPELLSLRGLLERHCRIGG